MSIESIGYLYCELGLALKGQISRAGAHTLSLFGKRVRSYYEWQRQQHTIEQLAVCLCVFVWVVRAARLGFIAHIGYWYNVCAPSADIVRSLANTHICILFILNAEKEWKKVTTKKASQEQQKPPLGNQITHTHTRTHMCMQRTENAAEYSAHMETNTQWTSYIIVIMHISYNWYVRDVFGLIFLVSRIQSIVINAIAHALSLPQIFSSTQSAALWLFGVHNLCMNSYSFFLHFYYKLFIMIACIHAINYCCKFCGRKKVRKKEDKKKLKHLRVEIHWMLLEWHTVSINHVFEIDGEEDNIDHLFFDYVTFETVW